MLCYEEEVLIEASRVEPFGCTMANIFEVQGMISIGFWTFHYYLQVEFLSCLQFL